MRPDAPLAVLVQFWSPGRAYGMLSDPGSAAAALASTAAVCLAIMLAASSTGDFESAVERYAEARSLELVESGSSEAEADSTVAAEVDAIRLSRRMEPFAGLVERCLVAAAAGTAAWGLGRTSRTGPGLHIAAASLAQGAYVVSAAAFALLSTVLTGSPAVPGLLVLAGRPPASPGPVEAALRVAAGSVDLPSIVTVAIWGLGIAAVSSWRPLRGIRTAAVVYAAGVLLVSSLALAGRG